MKVAITPTQFKQLRDLEARCAQQYGNFLENMWFGGVRSILRDSIADIPDIILAPMTIELVVDWSPCRTCQRAPCRCMHPLFAWETDKAAKRRQPL